MGVAYITNADESWKSSRWQLHLSVLATLMLALAFIRPAVLGPSFRSIGLIEHRWIKRYKSSSRIPCSNAVCGRHGLV